jgi:hypothetical protein
MIFTALAYNNCGGSWFERKRAAVVRMNPLTGDLPTREVELLGFRFMRRHK